MITVQSPSASFPASSSSCRILDEGSDDSDSVVLVYPSQAEMEDDLRGAHLPVSLALFGTHEPMEVRTSSFGRSAAKTRRITDNSRQPRSSR